MTQVWQGDKAVAVTRVKAGPCQVVQVKTKDSDGYEAIQLGFEEKRKKNINKPQTGHLKGLSGLRHLREFRTEAGGLKRGQIIDVSTFAPGDNIRVTGISKGKGFQGVVRRHGFKGTKKTHGNKDQLRMPGSVGATGPAHVFKGQRMPGRMGGDQVTTTGLEVVGVDLENNLLLIKGAVPGARNGLVLVQGDGELKVRNEDVGGVKEDSKKSKEESGKVKSEKTKEEKAENNDVEGGKSESEKAESGKQKEKPAEKTEAKKEISKK